MLLDQPETLAEQVQEKFGALADVIYETTGSWLPAAVRALANRGHICVIAPPNMGQTTVDFPVLDFYRRGGNLLGVNSLMHDTVSCASMLRKFSAHFDDGKLPPPPVAHEMPLTQGVEAYRSINKGGEKIVLTTDR